MEMISVIVPCYNIAPYVESCVRTIQNQSYTNLEILLVDDGSSDGTAEILEHLANGDMRIRVIHQENGGVTKARMSGVAAAKGEWIGFVDGDDFIEPDMYERLYKNAIVNGADISHCGYQMVFPSRVDYYYNTGRLIRQDQETSLKDLLEGSFIEPGLWNKLFHKTLFHSLLHDDLMDYSIKNTEDLLMNFYLFRESQSAVFEDFCPYHYILRKGSAATSKLNEHKLKDPLKVFLQLEKETAHNKTLSCCVKRSIAAKLVNLSTYYTREQEELVKPVRNWARKELLRRLPEIIRSDYTLKMKSFAVWAAAFPYSYHLVHSVYSHAAGHNKKYEVK